MLYINFGVINYRCPKNYFVNFLTLVGEISSDLDALYPQQNTMLNTDKSTFRKKTYNSYFTGKLYNRNQSLKVHVLYCMFEVDDEIFSANLLI